MVYGNLGLNGLLVTSPAVEECECARVIVMVHFMVALIVEAVIPTEKNVIHMNVQVCTFITSLINWS